MPAYRLELSNQAEKALRQIGRYRKELYPRIARALDDLQEDPSLGKPLKGILSGRFSFRVADHRIIYTVRRNILLVFVIDIGHRRDVYR